MTRKRFLLSATLIGPVLCVASPSTAQTTSQLQSLQQQIQQLQQQLQSLQRQVDEAQAQAQKAQDAAARAQAATQTRASSPPADDAIKATLSPGNRPGICTADGANCIELTSRLHLDVANYLNVEPQSPTGPHSLTSGINARRARIGVLGKFAEDWHYALVYDFGGNADSGNAGVNASGIEQGWLSYEGLRPFAFEIGYMDVPWTLDGATSTNDIMFLERSTPGIVAANLVAGDFRSAAGVRANNDRYWAGVYLTGPNSGALHSGSNGQQFGGVARATYQVLQGDNHSLHLGVDAGRVFMPRANGGSSTSIANALTLSDRPELRVDPTIFLNTGPIPSKEANIYGAEVAGGYDSLFFQGEYYHFAVDQAGSAPGALLPGLDFDGGYLQASWTMTGESRKYIPTTGAYSAITPARPFSLGGGGWGALELAARYSYIDLNSKITPGVAQALTGGVFGGTQTIYTLGVNWYPIDNVRFMLDYMHADINKRAADGVTPAGVKIDALALRTQVAF
jgi:phosphate-selective porin OprO/OprP